MTKTKQDQRGENTAIQIDFFMTLKLRTKILTIILIGENAIKARTTKQLIERLNQFRSIKLG